jgi:hypothetical protein
MNKTENMTQITVNKITTKIDVAAMRSVKTPPEN